MKLFDEIDYFSDIFDELQVKRNREFE